MNTKFACLRESSDGVSFSVYATPRASKTEIVDMREEQCRIRVKAPPVDGEANTALVNTLAKIFGISKKSVILEKGQKGKNKVFSLKNLSLEQANLILERILSKKER